MSATRIRCTWCLAEDGELTKDHVFPRALGGTLELFVWACKKCQTLLSRCEQEAARRSELGLQGVDEAPPPRHKDRPTSGLFDATYVLAEYDGIGHHTETAIRAGAKTPIPLPYISIDLKRNQAIKGGLDQADVSELLDKVRELLKGSNKPKQLLTRVDLMLLDSSDPLVQDERFHPRIFMDPAGHLHVRARDRHEAQRFAKTFLQIRAHPFFRDPGRWRLGQVVAGTSHRAEITYEWGLVNRVVTKIAYGVLVSALGAEYFEKDPFKLIREFIMGEASEAYDPVRRISGVGSLTEFPGDHFVSIEGDESGVLGIVSVSGSCYTVDFGGGQRIGKQYAAMSHRNGSRSFLADEEVGGKISTTLREHIKQKVGASDQ
jgi:hypothetical protein